MSDYMMNDIWSYYITNNRLTIECSYINKKGVQNIKELLIRNKHINDLFFYKNIITNNALYFLKELFLMNNFTHLQFIDNDLKDNGGLILCKIIKNVLSVSSSSISYLYINNNIGDEGVIELAHGLSANTSVESNDITNDGCEELANTLSTHSSLTYLVLNSNNISSIGMEALATALTTNSKLLHLSLSYTQSISFDFFEGIKALANALTTNSTLTHLYLSRNFIGYKGAIVLAEALCKNSTLTYLDLTSNELGDEGIKVLASAFHTNFTLIELILFDNDITEEGGKELANIFISNSTLEHLSLGVNKISSETKKLISSRLKENHIFQKEVEQMLADGKRTQLIFSYLPFYIRQAILFSNHLSNEQNLRLSDYILKSYREPINKFKLLNMIKKKIVY